MARPPKFQRVSFFIRTSQWERLQRLARQQETTASALLRKVIDRAIDEATAVDRTPHVPVESAPRPN